jgi:nicotinamidase-related amidase
MSSQAMQRGNRHSASLFPITMPNSAHICVDMQSMFAEDTEWHAPWLGRVLPAVESLVDRCPDRTIFTRFIPPENAQTARGAWKSYYRRWQSMTRDTLPPELLDVVPSLRRYVPPARTFDKPTYSPWFDGTLHTLLRSEGVETIFISGGETDVCVLATLLGAIDLGYRVVLPTDAVFGSADETHDAILTVYRSRFTQQLTICTTDDAISHWEELAA